MTAPLPISFAGPGDAAAIARVQAACFDDPAWEVDTVTSMLARPTTVCVVCRRDAAIVGYALCRLAADECEVLSCAVRPHARGGGIARRLLAAAFWEARSRGARCAFLEVDETNLSARALYDALGLRKVGRRRGYYLRAGRDASDALVMALDL